MKTNRFGALLTLFAVVSCLLPLSASAQPSVTKTFCVRGTSDGQGWRWELKARVAQQVNAPGVPEGGSATDLARRWVQSIQAAQGDPPAFRARFLRTGRDGAAYFSITSPQDFTFRVDDCTITGNPEGCSFNPTVLEVDDVDTVDPPQTSISFLVIVVIVIILIVIIIVIIIIVVRRRR